jgi:hypothetical protein
MAYITGSVIDSFGVLPFSLSAGTQLSMSIQNSLPGVSYYGLETVPDGNGFYNPTTPRNLSGSFILGSGIVDVVYDGYKMVAAVAPGGGTLTYTPAVAIEADTLRTRGTGASLGPVDFGTLLASSYSKRVTTAGGYVESPDSITAAIAATPILKDASFLYVPSGYASGSAFAEISTNDYSDLVWTRASSGSRSSSLNVIENVGPGIPRLDYTYGTSPASLLEPQRTNIALWSEDLTQTAWVKTNSGTITANTTISPDGTQTADTLTAGAISGQVQQAQTGTSGAVYTVSIWVKRITGTGNVFLRAVENADTLIAVTSDWQRFTATVTSTSTVIRIGVKLATSGDEVAIWGGQIELGAYPTTYIPTTSATATRVADSFTRNNIFTNGLITSSGGTWFVEFRGNVPLIRDAFGAGLYISDTTNISSNNINIRNGGTSRLAINKVIAGVSTPLYLTTTDTTKLAIKWNGTTADIFANGTKVISATAFTPTNMEFLRGDTTDVPKYIQQMALYGQPLAGVDMGVLTGASYYPSFLNMAQALNYTIA